MQLSGQRQQALRQYQVLKEALCKELDIEPEPQTIELYEDILAGRVAADESNQRQAIPQVPAERLYHNLPADLTSFVGREKEISEISFLLQANRLVTLTGVGGTGKTRLALKVGENVLSDFPNGVWLVELAGLGDPELVPRTIAAALRLQESSNRPLIDQLQNYLREKQVLLILDNCEHVVNECASVANSLLQACPRLKMLTSSREALNVSGEVAYQVPSLPMPDHRHLPLVEEFFTYAAMRLFIERAASAQPGFSLTEANAPAIAQICYRLDGIPLAIELAAARVSVLNVEQIATRLDNRFRLLTGGSRTAMPRQQTLRASIDWSYSLLEDTERLLLLRLSVFYGGWTLELASEVCAFDGLDEFDVIDGLAQLANKSLLLVETEANGGTRYRMLETIRQYANEKLLDSNESEIVRDRHLSAYTLLAKEAEPQLRSQQQVEWLDRLETEFDNLRAALKWALDGDAVKGLSLATSIYWFWHIRGYRVEGEQWLQHLQDRLIEEPITDEGKMLLAEARARQTLFRVSSGGNADRIAEEAVALANALGEAGKRAQLIALQAWIWNTGMDADETYIHELNQKGLAMAEELGDRFLIAEFLSYISISEPDFIRGRAYAQKHLELRRELGDLDGEMTALMFLVSYYYSSGDIENACLQGEEAFRIAQKVENRWGMIITRLSLGSKLCESGELEKGIAFLQQALTFSEDLGEAIWIAWSYNALARAAGLSGDWELAEKYNQLAIAGSRSRQDIDSEVISCINLAESAWKRGLHDLAGQHYQAAAEIGQGLVAGSVERLVLYGSGKAALIRGDLDSADRFFRAAMKGFMEQHNPIEIQSKLLQAMAVVYSSQSGQDERAALLHGAAYRKHKPYIGWGNMIYLEPFDLDTLLSPTKEALGETEYARLYKKGHSMNFQQAAELVLGETD
jgi:predicted ATPase